VELSVTTSRQDDVSVVTVSGEVDVYTAAQLRATLEEQVTALSAVAPSLSASELSDLALVIAAFKSIDTPKADEMVARLEPLAAPGPSRSVSIVTQTCVRPDCNEEFARWQGETSSFIQHFPGFIEQRLLPPNPPLQVDWVIPQRFASLADAQRWLGSPERQKRIEGAAPMLVGRDDVHIVQDETGGIKPALWRELTTHPRHAVELARDAAATVGHLF